MKDLEKKFKGYEFEVDIPDKENFDPLNEAVQIILTTRDGRRYSANIVTTGYIPYIFEKNKRTGECANGTCFGMPDNMVLVEEINKKNIRTSIDYYIKTLEIESYLTEIV